MLQIRLHFTYYTLFRFCSPNAYCKAEHFRQHQTVLQKAWWNFTTLKMYCSQSYFRCWCSVKSPAVFKSVMPENSYHFEGSPIFCKSTSWITWLINDWQPNQLMKSPTSTHLYLIVEMSALLQSRPDSQRSCHPCMPNLNSVAALFTLSCFGKIT